MRGVRRCGNQRNLTHPVRFNWNNSPLPAAVMALVDSGEQESFSALSRTESSMSDGSYEQDDEEAGFRREDDSDVWSSSDEDMFSLRESEFSGAAVQRITNNEGMTLTSEPISKQEIMRQAHLRRHVDSLQKKKLRAEEEVAKQEESLAACRENLKSLCHQCTELQLRVTELEQRKRRGEGEGRGGEGEEEGRSVASCGFLRAHLGRVRGEIEREEEVEKELVDKLKAAQLELSSVAMAYSDYQETEEELRGRERQIRTAKNLQALQRLQTQTRMRVNAHRVKRSQERLTESHRRLEETREKEAVERARQTLKEGQAFLQKTLETRRAREMEEQERERGESERRMNAVLSLKKNIESSEGTIQALQLLQEERSKKTRLREKQLRAQAIARGENPDEVMLRRQREKEESRKRAKFEEKRREKHMEIVTQLLEEDKMKSRSEKKVGRADWQGHWPHDATHQSVTRKRGEKHREKNLHGINTKHTEKDEGENPVISGNDEAVYERGGGETTSDESDDDDNEGEGGRGEGASSETLAQPEINGLWNLHSGTTARQPLEEEEKEEGKGEDGGRERRRKERSKLEQQTLTHVVENLRQSIVKKQVVAGREFKGRPFTSKPESVEFKDFSPGERLKTRLVLTNVTYTVNYCKLVGVSPHLRDFITVDFNPPGAMSAGLTCHMTVTFEPKLNKDLEGEIEMLTQTGTFSIPVRCTTRKCIVHATTQTAGGSSERKGEDGEGACLEVDFGKVCVGETVQRTIVLRNDGTLPTEFFITSSKHSRPKLLGSETEVSSSNSASEGMSAAPSESSLPSVMSEVTGDWGAVARLKSSHRPVSRSTSELPQLVGVPQQPGGADPTATTENREMTAVDQSKPGQKSSKPSAPAKMDKTSTKQDQRSTTIAVKQYQIQSTQDQQLSSSQEKLDTPGRTEGTEEEERAAEEEEKETLTEYSTIEEKSSPAIVIEKNREAGHLDGYSSCRVELSFSPTTASLSSQLFTVSFTQTGVKPITVKAIGEGLDLPIFVSQDTIDLKICTTNSLYQDTIQVHNRGNTALRVAFTLPPELAPHLEISPPHGLVQGASSFSAQLKFLPLPGIFTECEKYFKDDCLRIPAEIRVVDQVLPVPYSIQARLTTSDLVFSSSDIDFGTCTIHESVVATLNITNTSILSQEFGFVHLPDCVDVQPNDGVGTILPQETLSLDLIFSASKPRDYSLELTCLTHLNRSFKISCKGRGVLPALKLSENVINFTATPLNTLATARISISNPRLSRLSSAVIRGAVLPQGPKVFEFWVPDGVPMEISPRVGTINLDETVSVEVSYTPSLSHAAIQEEAMRLTTETARLRAREEVLADAQQIEKESASTPEQKKGSRVASRAESQRKKRKGKGETTSSSGRESEASGRKSGEGGGGFATEGERTPRIEPGGATSGYGGEEGVKVDAPKEGSETWRQAVANLLNGFQNWTHQFSIPCFVSSAAPASELDTVPYRPEDTLYVEVCVPVVKPSLLILSNDGSSSVDFGSVATGDSLSKQLTVKNISDNSIQLMSSPLDPNGPFELRNALRPIPPSATHTLSLMFSPQHGGRFYEVMKLSHSKTGGGGMDLRLIGNAVEPHVVLEPDNDGMDFGHTYMGDTSIRKFHLKNTCTLGVRYNIELRRKGAKFGAANFSGKPVFDCVPFQGRIEPESVTEFQVFFSPDHQSAHYSDTLTININDTPTHTLKLTGQASSSTMYILGSDNQSTEAELESLAAGVPALGPDGEQVELVQPVLVLFDEAAAASEGGEGGGVVTREVEIGCIKSAAVKKNTGDFTIEPIPPSNPHSKTFTFNPTKATVEAGSTKTVVISFHPPQSAVDGGIIDASTNIILKGDTTRTCKLLLRAITAD